MFAYPENVVLQWLIEWGVPVGVGGLVAMVVGLRPNTVLARSSTASGAWAGLVTVAIHNLVDLGSEIPGLVLAPVVCAAIVVGGTAGRDSRWGLDRWSRRPRAVALGGLITASFAIAVALAAMSGRAGTRIRQRPFNDAATAGGGSTEEVLGLARAAMPPPPRRGRICRSPSPGTPAHEQDDDHDRRGSERPSSAPSPYGPAHLVLARFLARRARAQVPAGVPTRARAGAGIGCSGSSMREVSPLVRSLLRCDGGWLPQATAEWITPWCTSSRRLDWRSTSCNERPARGRNRADARRAIRPPSLQAARNAVDDIEDEGRSTVVRRSRPCGGCAMRIALDSAGSRRAARADDVRTLRPARARPDRRRERGQGPLRGRRLRPGSAVTDRCSACEALVTLAETGARRTLARAPRSRRSPPAGCSDDGECAQNLAWIASIEEDATATASRPWCSLRSAAYSRAIPGQRRLPPGCGAAHRLQRPPYRGAGRLRAPRAQASSEQSNWRSAADVAARGRAPRRSRAALRAQFGGMRRSRPRRRRRRLTEA